MLGDGRDYLSSAWWIARLARLVSIFLITLSMSIIGDWLRDRLDPTLLPTDAADTRTRRRGIDVHKT